MKKYYVLQSHESSAGTRLKGTVTEYNERLGKELVSRGIIAEYTEPVVEKKKPGRPKKNS